MSDQTRPDTPPDVAITNGGGTAEPDDLDLTGALPEADDDTEPDDLAGDPVEGDVDVEHLLADADTEEPTDG